MPDDPNAQPNTQPTTPTPPANGSETPPPAKSWDEIYAAMDPAAKAAHDAHTAGLKSALEKERATAAEAAKAKAALEAAQNEAEAARLAEKGEYKTLADQRAAELAALQSKQAELSATAEAAQAAAKEADAVLQKVLEQKKSSLTIPKGVEALLASMPTVKQLEWLAANGDQFGGTPNVPPSPRASSNGALTPAEKAALVARTW